VNGWNIIDSFIGLRVFREEEMSKLISERLF
jgi:hypothetical protein